MLLKRRFPTLSLKLEQSEFLLLSSCGLCGYVCPTGLSNPACSHFSRGLWWAQGRTCLELIRGLEVCTGPNQVTCEIALASCG